MQEIMKAAIETIAEKNGIEYSELVEILSGKHGNTVQKKAANQVAKLIASIVE